MWVKWQCIYVYLRYAYARYTHRSQHRKYVYVPIVYIYEHIHACITASIKFILCAYKLSENEYINKYIFPSFVRWFVRSELVPFTQPTFAISHFETIKIRCHAKCVAGELSNVDGYVSTTQNESEAHHDHR